MLSQECCSKSCAITFRNLTSENPSYKRNISGKNNPMYGKGMKGKENPMYGKRGPLSPRWNGGRKYHNSGYYIIRVPDNHPHPTATEHGAKYILEHRYVMEQHLGRYLDPQEVVHHKDGNKLNNAIENLQLFKSQGEHLGTCHSQIAKKSK
jgi:hypothetical protein